MREFLPGLLFGGSCYLCRGSARSLLCAECQAELPRLPRALCVRCALPAPPGMVCGRCLSAPPAFDATVAALAYDFPADTLVHALKFRGELALAPLLGALLKAHLGAIDVDLVIPVPLSRRRLTERGYNQALEIARHVARDKVDFELCVRRADTAPQMQLPWAQRQRNVRGAFLCRRQIAGARVAVVDDVMTTGATLDELARTLKRAGAASVVNWVVARTLQSA